MMKCFLPKGGWQGENLRPRQNQSAARLRSHFRLCIKDACSKMMRLSMAVPCVYIYPLEPGPSASRSHDVFLDQAFTNFALLYFQNPRVPHVELLNYSCALCEDHPAEKAMFQVVALLRSANANHQ